MHKRLLLRISPVNTTRLARVFCANVNRDAVGHDVFNNYLLCLVRGVNEDDDLCMLARAQDDAGVLELVRMPLDKLASKSKKTRREEHVKGERENSKFGKQFKTDVLESLDRHTEQQASTRKTKLWPQ